jgi:hypothetical protein
MLNTFCLWVAALVLEKRRILKDGDMTGSNLALTTPRWESNARQVGKAEN